MKNLLFAAFLLILVCTAGVTIYGVYMQVNHPDIEVPHLGLLITAVITQVAAVIIAIARKEFGLSFRPVSRVDRKISSNDTSGLLLDKGGKSLFLTRRTPVKFPYDSTEGQRLDIQANRNRELDLRAIEHALHRLNDKKNIRVLDAGCGNGTVTADRFGDQEIFSDVVGVDLDSEVIGSAINTIDGDQFSFNVYDLEHDSFVAFCRKLGKRSGQNYDLIFTALTLHHLANPTGTLHSLFQLIRPGGVIIIRGSDDGAKTCWPNPDNLLERIFSVTNSADGISDRENARQVYSMLKASGFHHIESMYDAIDTIGMSREERLAFFKKSFSFRLKYLERAIRDGQENLREKHKWLSDALVSLKNHFESDTFYYLEFSHIFIATKRN